MNKILKNSWALFLGMGFLMMAYGFQGSLLGVRAVREEFSLTSTGFMMSGYFVGYFIGAATIPKFISRVGHIRVFAAFASLASLVILVHSVLISPFIWFILRVLTGVSMVCIYTVAESWLNDRSSNKNRGSVLSVYMVILYGAMGIGMFLLNFSRPENFQPFILISVITSAALIPILLTKKKPPTFKKIQAMTLKDLYDASPFGMVSSLFYGTIQSALFTLLAVYATSMNFSILEISKSSIPTITGIGHEPDTTLSDYASDLTKETPTAAAMAAVPDIQVIRSSLLQLDLSLGRVVSKKFEFLTYSTSSKNFFSETPNLFSFFPVDI